MATRLYLPSSGSPSISPAFDASWELTSQATRRNARRGPTNTVIVEQTADDTSAAEVDVLFGQYVFGPIGAHTFGGTIKGQFQFREPPSGGGSSDFRAQLVVRVVSPDGLTVRGTLYGPDTGVLSSEFFPALAAHENRKVPRGGAQSLAAVAAQEGDYVVIEVGFHSHNATSSTRTGSVRLGDPTAATDPGDLPEDETTQGSGPRAWIEFSDNIPIVAADAYDEAIRDLNPTAYFKMDETSGTVLVDKALTHNLDTSGSPTLNQTGPHTGWKAVSFDGIDDLADAGMQEGMIQPYSGPLTIVGWAKTSNVAQGHGECLWTQSAGNDLVGSGSFEMRDLGTGVKWTFHFQETGTTVDDVQGAAPVVDQWEFFAATLGPNGVKLYLVSAGDVVLQQTNTGIAIGGYDVWRFGADQNPDDFGEYTISRTAIFKAELTEAQLQGIFDAANGGGGGTAILKVVNESEQATDSEIRTLALVRSHSENSNFSESIQRFLGILKADSDEVSANEAIQRFKGILRQSNEATEQSDAVERYRGIFRIKNESEESSESLQRFLSLIRQTAESSSQSEEVQKSKSMVRRILESSSISESTTKLVDIVRSVLENSTVIEVFSRLVSLLRGTDDQIQSSETIEKYRGIFRVVDESSSQTESSSNFRGIFKQTNEDSQVSESQQHLKGLIRIHNEANSVSETHFFVRGLTRVIGEETVTGEQILTTSQLLRIVEESETETESATKFMALVRIEDEAISATEEDIEIRSLIVTVSESANLPETIIQMIVTLSGETSSRIRVRGPVARVRKSGQVKKFTKGATEPWN